MSSIKIMGLSFLVLQCFSFDNKVACAQPRLTMSHGVADGGAQARFITPQICVDGIFTLLSAQPWFQAGAYAREDLVIFVHEQLTEICSSGLEIRCWIEKNFDTMMKYANEKIVACMQSPSDKATPQSLRCAPRCSPLRREWLGDADMLRNAGLLAKKLYQQNSNYADDQAIVNAIQEAVDCLPECYILPLDRAVLVAYKKLCAAHAAHG